MSRRWSSRSCERPLTYSQSQFFDRPNLVIQRSVSDEGPRPPTAARSSANHYVYILSNVSRTLYVGVTNDLAKRVSEHRLGRGGAFTQKYHCHMLVWYARFSFANDAIAAEKKMKGWSRAKKLAMIIDKNPGWRDLLPQDASGS